MIPVTLSESYAQDTNHPNTASSSAINNNSDIADTIRTDTPSGLPVPRFVSLKSDKVNCRSGPSLQHPKELTFIRKGLPVRITAETLDHWRRVEDNDGDSCWVHSTLLSGVTTALVIKQKAHVLATAKPDARIRAKIDAGVIVRVRKCKMSYCQVNVDNIAGWVLKDTLWGYRG